LDQHNFELNTEQRKQQKFKFTNTIHVVKLHLTTTSLPFYHIKNCRYPQWSRIRMSWRRHYVI